MLLLDAALRFALFRRRVLRQAFNRALIDRSNLSRVVAGSYMAARVWRAVVRRKPEFIVVEKLQPGQAITVRSLGPRVSRSKR